MRFLRLTPFAIISLCTLCEISIAESEFSLQDRMYFRYSSMFSVEAAGGYEHRFNDILGLSIGLEGGFHFFDTLGNGLSHIGPQLGLAFYSHGVNSSHQFFLAPMLSVIYGKLKGHQQVIARYSATPHLMAGRINFIGGYRYTFSIPMTFDIGLGLDAISFVVPLNQSPPFIFTWPLPFLHLGLGYRF